MEPILVNAGSSKNVYEINGALFFEFTDQVSVFDRGPVPALFPGLGTIRCAIATKLFLLLKQSNFKTHYVRSIAGGNIMHVEPFCVPENNFSLPTALGRLLPLEVLFRFRVTENFLGRIETGEVNTAKVEKLMVSENLFTGAILYPPYIECSTKHRASDMYLSDLEAANLSGLSLEELECYYDQNIIPVAKFLRQVFRSAGFDLADGKFEVGLYGGELIILDSISPDELRLVGDNGLSYDKDVLRRWYHNYYPDWVEELKYAKALYPKDKDRWPDYPASPPYEVIDDLIWRYKAVAMAIGAI